MQNKQNLIVVSGNIGSGKSSTLQLLSQQSNFTVIQEPIHLWTNKIDGNQSHLEKLYQGNYSFEFQMLTLGNLHFQLNNIQNSSQNIVQERGILDSFIFANMLYDDHQINTHQMDIINQWYVSLNNIENDKYNKFYVYLKSDSDQCYFNIQTRGRSEELNIQKNYLEKLHQYHDKYLGTNSLISQQTNYLCIDVQQGNINHNIEQLLNFVNSLSY